MEMRATEDIEIGQDLTPPLPPLAFALHDSAISSHCSACFSPLPPHPFPPLTQIPCHVPTGTPSPLYCSPRCSSIDSLLHLSSAESHLLSLFNQSPPSAWDDSSDLRLSLRLLHIFQKLSREGVRLPRSSSLVKSDQRLYLSGNTHHHFRESENADGPDDNLENSNKHCSNTDGCIPKDCLLERIAGLMTNHERLVCPILESEEEEEEGKSPAETPRNCNEDSAVLEKIREGAEVMARARSICAGKDLNVVKQEDFSVEEMILCLVLTNAVEVQEDKTGRSIGIAVYNTNFSWINHSCSPNACYRFSVGFEHNGQPLLRISPAATEHGCGNENGNHGIIEGEDGYGPRVIVRSIKAVNKGEEVAIAYTDLLQPKDMRHLELWGKYRFHCHCKRCCVVPPTYVDRVLQAVCAVNLDCLEMISNNESCPDEDIEKLLESFENPISEFLSTGDSKSCCEKLENVLIHGNQPELNDGKSHRKLKLHPFHHLSLNAYTTLISAYKVYACDILALDSGKDEHNKLQAFHLFRTSAAYSLLIAGVSHHLFMSESSLLVSVANFWIYAGESLLSFTKNSLWDLEFSSLLSQKCDECAVNSVDSRDPSLQEKLLNWIAKITLKVWRFLACGSGYLKLVRNPIDFSWIESSAISASREQFSGFEAEECSDQLRIDLFLLSIHCLKYGALLSNICYGSPLSIDMYYQKKS